MISPTVLVVDDSPDIRVILRRSLSRRDLQVIEASNGIDAVRFARQYCPNLILIDLGLPGLDGWEAIRQMRTEPMLEETPIVAMTGYGLTSVAQAALRAGCQHIMFKPFNLDEIEKLVLGLLKPIISAGVVASLARCVGDAGFVN